ncbi:hypothetical protein GCM10009738_57020 [Kitasatospora viridis]
MFAGAVFARAAAGVASAIVVPAIVVPAIAAPGMAAKTAATTAPTAAVLSGRRVLRRGMRGGTFGLLALQGGGAASGRSKVRRLLAGWLAVVRGFVMIL